MKVLSVKVIGGRLDVPEGSLEEGTTVTLLVPDSERGFHLSEDDQERLREAMAQADHGQTVDGWELLDSLGS